MYDNIHQMLVTLKLKGMNEKFDMVLTSSEQKSLSTKKVIMQLLHEELIYRQERSIESRLRHAKLPWELGLETFPFDQQPSINKLQIKNFASLSFIERRENIILIGKPGTGKTGIATSLLREAVINGYRGRFYNAQQLLDDLYSALADRHSSKLIKQLSSYDLLIIDELGYLTLNVEQCNAFFKLMDARYLNKKSTIITTNLEYEQWYHLFNQKELVDAMLDRLKHHCHTIHIKGKSLRVPTATGNKTTDHKHLKSKK